MQADAKQKFVVGFDASFPPYGYLSDDGEYIGFDLDLAAEVAKRNGWELVKQPIDWEAKMCIRDRSYNNRNFSRSYSIVF